jgi:ATPase subunit of ABC transporter with duplicated ATPase domains
LIQLSELTKSFGDRVLFDHVTWQITDRERAGLCGPNGAGKTTLLRMMAGLDSPIRRRPQTLGVCSATSAGRLSHSGHGVRRAASVRHCWP